MLQIIIYYSHFLVLFPQIAKAADAVWAEAEAWVEAEARAEEDAWQRMSELNVPCV